MQSSRQFQSEVLDSQEIGPPNSSAAADYRFGPGIGGARMQWGTCSWWRMKFGALFRGKKQTSNSKCSANPIRGPKFPSNRTPNSSAAADGRLGRRVGGAIMKGGTCCWWRLKFGTWFRGKNGRRILSARQIQFEVLNSYQIGRPNCGGGR